MSEKLTKQDIVDILHILEFIQMVKLPIDMEKHVERLTDKIYRAYINE